MFFNVNNFVINTKYTLYPVWETASAQTSGVSVIVMPEAAYNAMMGASEG